MKHIITIYKYIALTVIVVFLNQHVIEAQADSLLHYLEVAANNNPGVKASLINYQASRQRVPQVGSIPDPQLDVSFFLPSMDIIDGSQVADFTLMLMFPWFGTRKAAQTEAEHKANVAYENFRESRDNLLLDVYKQWYLLGNLQQKLNNNRQHKNHLDKLEQLALRLYSSSRSSSESSNMSEVVRIKLETLELENNMESIKSELNAQKAKFNTLLGRPADVAVHIPDSLIQINYNLNIPEIMSQISINNPKLLSLNEEYLAYDARIKSDKKSGMPMLGVGLQYSVVKKRMGDVIPTTDMNGMDMIMPMVSFTIPIYRAKYKAQQKESRLLQQMSQEQYMNTYSLLESELYSINHQLEDAKRKIELTMQQSNLAQSAYNMVLQDLSTGRSSLANVIQVQRQMLDYQLKKSEAIAEYNILVASVQHLISFNNIEPSTKSEK